MPAIKKLFFSASANSVPRHKIATSEEKNAFLKCRFTTIPLTHVKRKSPHPSRSGYCYLYLVHPIYWQLAVKHLQKWPKWFQVQSFMNQLLEQAPCSEQLSLLATARLDFTLRNNHLHINTKGTITGFDMILNQSIPTHLPTGGKKFPRQFSNPIHWFAFVLLALITFVSLFATTVRKSNINLSPTLLTTWIISLALFFTTSRRSAINLQHRLALASLIPLLLRFVTTGHFLTDLATNTTSDPPEITWILNKIIFLTCTLPRPRGLKWLLPSVLFWNTTLSVLAVSFGYQYFCSMVDAQLPFNRLSQEQIWATNDQLAECANLKKSLYELYLVTQGARA